MGWNWPITPNVSQPYGGKGGHPGIDLQAAQGTPVGDSTAGVVESVQTPLQSGGYGNLVTVRSDGGYQELYAHLSRVDVHPGQQVNPGDLIGLVGSTGNSTGPHLHFEVRFNGQTVNPASLVDQPNLNPVPGTGATQDPNAGAGSSSGSSASSIFGTGVGSRLGLIVGGALVVLLGLVITFHEKGSATNGDSSPVKSPPAAPREGDQ